MRDIAAETITETIRDLCVDACENLPQDVEQALEECLKRETWPAAADALALLKQNAKLAREQSRPLCQDTGMACVFLELGQEVHIVGGSLMDAVNEGVRRGYTEGYLRKSIVDDPLRRKNTQDNTPAFLHTDIVPGDILRITVTPKGIGSE
ncbi:fumarate hydratase, partial [Ruminococcaceae bacterium OttesenSCG-928-I18]|nr:fumarate hydratase [Ruminococcaceae bacterium OttesenSCG-928-I18]